MRIFTFLLWMSIPSIAAAGTRSSIEPRIDASRDVHEYPSFAYDDLFALSSATALEKDESFSLAAGYRDMHYSRALEGEAGLRLWEGKLVLGAAARSYSSQGYGPEGLSGQVSLGTSARFSVGAWVLAELLQRWSPEDQVSGWRGLHFAMGLDANEASRGELHYRLMWALGPARPRLAVGASWEYVLSLAGEFAPGVEADYLAVRGGTQYVLYEDTTSVDAAFARLSLIEKEKGYAAARLRWRPLEYFAMVAAVGVLYAVDLEQRFSHAYEQGQQRSDTTQHADLIGPLTRLRLEFSW